MIRLFFFLLIMVYSSPSNCQILGCTDPLANNYNEQAEINDGSCQYPFTTFTPEIIGGLPPEVPETSGLVLHKGCLWTHNDSGWQPELFCLDPEDGSLIRRVWVENAGNRDWEEITMDENYLYIGDFGNNNGNRRDLVIYKVPLTDLELDTVFPTEITFEYPDQRDFSSRPLENDFDMEAMISFGDSLYLFSKNWESLNTRVYSLPKEPGDYIASLLDSFEVNGLITGASFNPEDSLIALVGYTTFLQPFTWLFWDFKGSSFFSGNKRRIELTIPFHQVEAICWNPDENYFYLSNERFDNIITVPARLHKFEVDQWIQPEISSTENFTEILPLKIFPNPAGHTIYIQLIDQHFPASLVREDRKFNLKIYNYGGQLVLNKSIDSSLDNFSLNVENVSSGKYILEITNGINRFVTSFIKE
ncbi:MAG: T9SS C-terminal target domain-containing protein [Saprospirales bacterium]|nr:MAG: T9SS C-terminal target domain-containing protein [Saprospirales bacterium]